MSSVGESKGASGDADAQQEAVHGAGSPGFLLNSSPSVMPSHITDSKQPVQPIQPKTSVKPGTAAAGDAEAQQGAPRAAEARPAGRFQLLDWALEQHQVRIIHNVNET